MLFVYSDSFTSSLPTCIHFIPLSCLMAVARTFNTMSNRRGKIGHPVCFMFLICGYHGVHICWPIIIDRDVFIVILNLVSLLSLYFFFCPFLFPFVVWFSFVLCLCSFWFIWIYCMFLICGYPLFQVCLHLPLSTCLRLVVI